MNDMREETHCRQDSLTNRSGLAIRVTACIGLVVMWSLGCGPSTKRAYPGPARPPSDVAVLVLAANDLSVDITIKSVDSQKVNVKDADTLEMEPGTRELKVLLELVPSRPQATFTSMHDLLGQPRVTAWRNLKVSLEAQAGRKYHASVGIVDDRPLFWIVDESSNEKVVEQEIPR